MSYSYKNTATAWVNHSTMQVEQCIWMCAQRVVVLQLTWLTFCVNIRCVEKSYLHKKSALSGLSEWIKWKKKSWWHTPNEHVMWVWCAKEQNTLGQVKGASELQYPPGGGETSREISGRGGAPLLSGATLSEHMTNIVVDGTAAFYKHKASASAMPLSALHSNIHTKTNTHKRVLTHRNTHFIYTHTLS